MSIFTDVKTIRARARFANEDGSLVAKAIATVRVRLKEK